MINLLFKNILIFQTKLILKKFKPKIYLVIGDFNVGSTKFFLYSLLKLKSFSLVSVKNHKNFLDLFSVILAKRRRPWIPFLPFHFIFSYFSNLYPKNLVLHGKLSDLEDLKKILNDYCQILILTGSEFEEIADYRSIILNYSSQIIINLDFISESDFQFLSKEHKKNKIITYSINNSSADIFLKEYQIIENQNLPFGAKYQIVYKKNIYELEINGFLGRQKVYEVLPYFILADFYNFNISELILGLKNQNIWHNQQMAILRLNNFLLIKDTYNISPESFKLAFNALAEIKKNGRKIVILGDILNLEEESMSEHRKIADLIKKSDFNCVLTLGIRSSLIIDELKNSNNFKLEIFHSINELINFLEHFLEDDDICLIKGSQSIGFSKITEELKIYFKS